MVFCGSVLLPMKKTHMAHAAMTWVSITFSVWNVLCQSVMSDAASDPIGTRFEASPMLRQCSANAPHTHLATARARYE